MLSTPDKYQQKQTKKCTILPPHCSFIVTEQNIDSCLYISSSPLLPLFPPSQADQVFRLPLLNSEQKVYLPFTAQITTSSGAESPPHLAGRRLNQTGQQTNMSLLAFIVPLPSPVPAVSSGDLSIPTQSIKKPKGGGGRRQG